LVQCDFVNPFQLFYAPRPVFVHGQVWRLLVGPTLRCVLARITGLGQTNFVYFGELSLDFCFHLFFFARYSKMLETGAFSGRSADFLWLLVISATLLLVCCLLDRGNLPETVTRS
jgi:Derlin-2/3